MFETEDSETTIEEINLQRSGERPYLDSDDLLWRQLKTIPAFRALLRAVESRFYRQVTLPEPILDVGCGDGHFAQMTFDHPLTAGIDPWWGPLQRAQSSGQYRQVLQSMGDCLPFPDHTFASAISNSVLEHIPDVQPVLNEVSRVLQPVRAPDGKPATTQVKVVRGSESQTLAFRRTNQ